MFLALFVKDYFFPLPDLEIDLSTLKMTYNHQNSISNHTETTYYTSYYFLFSPSKHGPCGPVLVSDRHILAILAYKYANNYRHWSSLSKPINAKWCSANNLQYWPSLGKTIDRHYGITCMSGNILSCIGNMGGDVFMVLTSVFTRGHHTLHWIIATFLDRIVSVVCSHRVTSDFVHISY